jgi:hypothetical protein
MSALGHVRPREDAHQPLNGADVTTTYDPFDAAYWDEADPRGELTRVPLHPMQQVARAFGIAEEPEAIELRRRMSNES